MAIFSFLAGFCEGGDELCFSEYNGFTFNQDGVFGVQKLFNATAGFDGFVGFLMLGAERCRAHVGPEDEPDCDCDIVTCEGGNKAAFINCTSYADGLSLNLCDDPDEGDNSSILSVLNGQLYGRCEDLDGLNTTDSEAATPSVTNAPEEDETGSVATEVERTDPEAITKPPVSPQGPSSPGLEGSVTSASWKRIVVSRPFVLGPLGLLGWLL